jgi:hypothetical protein
VTTFNEADAVARYQALEKVETKNRQKADDQRLARALIVADAKDNLDADAFKEFLTKIECADSTSRELLKIAAAGSADATRRATALRVAQHRARKAAVTLPDVTAPPVTPDAPEVVERAYTGRGGQRFKKQVEAECKRVGGVDLEFSEAPVGPRTITYSATYRLPKSEPTVAPVTDTTREPVTAPPLAPEPPVIEPRPAINRALVNLSLADINRLFDGIDDNTELAYDASDVDLELYDLVRAVARKVGVIADMLSNVPAIAEARDARYTAACQAAEAKREAQKEAAAAARVARIKWEIDHGQEARERYYAEALADAKQKADDRGGDDEFNQAEFDASYEPGEDGHIGLMHPQHDFFVRWKKEHNALWPNHRDEAPKEYKRRPRRLPTVTLDIEVTPKLRKLYDASQEDDGRHEARCALAAFLKVKPPSPAPSTNCDYSIDPADLSYQDRWEAYDQWRGDNAEYLAYEDAVQNKIWRVDEPEEAAEHDREQAKQEAEREKRLKTEAKAPDKAKTKALDQAKRSAMADDMDEAKEEARENGERWGDVKEDWIEGWAADNWDEDAQAEAEADFLADWEQHHGKPFPASDYAEASKDRRRAA